jgi:type IV pilus assembly protein PilW
LVPVMRSNAGFSLIELMIASAIGLLLLSGLALIFVNTSEANRELQKSAQQIENGRYAIEIISQDLRLAGFYGHLHDMISIPKPGAMPDPCEATTAATLLSAFWYPVQGYAGTIHATTPGSDAAPSLAAAPKCTLLDAATLKPGSDVLVIRRADTNALATTDTATTNVFYVQASATNAQVQVGGGIAIGNNQADGVTASVLSLSNGALPAPPAPIRRLHVRVYFVAPCSIGLGASGKCNGSASEDKIPTLKRLELTTSGTFTIVPLVEGIEYLKVEYGIDDAPAAVNLATQLSGDATVDRFETAPSAAEWESVIAAKIYVLARNTEPTRGYSDTKRYVLGSLPATVQTPARNDEYKRHVYGAASYLANPAGRREIP